MQATANRIFKGRTGLVLLTIETDRVRHEIRYENLEGGTILFPHIYGALAVGCVTDGRSLAPGADGSFEINTA